MELAKIIEDEILTIKETSAYLKVSVESLRTLIRRQEIPVSRVGNQYRFRKDLIDAWLDQKAAKNYHGPLPTRTPKIELNLDTLLDRNQGSAELIDFLQGALHSLKEIQSIEQSPMETVIKSRTGSSMELQNPVEEGGIQTPFEDEEEIL